MDLGGGPQVMQEAPKEEHMSLKIIRNTIILGSVVRKTQVKKLYNRQRSYKQIRKKPKMVMRNENKKSKETYRFSLVGPTTGTMRTYRAFSSRRNGDPIYKLGTR
ncbi:hypothetical protein LPTSP1_02310 [Leptospira johnsonii]|uniref:Uncharacterized protein n=1 Tax=Leptospira johnsonii TaxID=1917820 RepID=A0A2P2CYC7_9LEPT|nr:hypothetical protein LPTSP1_02310 [Leptospira johnsonii]